MLVARLWVGVVPGMLEAARSAARAAAAQVQLALGRCSVSTNIASSAPLSSQVSSVSLSHPASRAPVRRQVALLCQSPDVFANSRGSTSGSVCVPPRAPPQGLAHGSKAAAGYTVCGWPSGIEACYGRQTLCEAIAHGMACGGLGPSVMDCGVAPRCLRR